MADVPLTLEPALREGRALLEHGPAPRASAAPVGCDWLSQATPAGARVLRLDECRGFFLDRAYVADSFVEASQLSADLGEAGSSVTQLRSPIDALQVSYVSITLGRRNPIARPPALRALLEDASQAQPAYRCPRRRCALYELR